MAFFFLSLRDPERWHRGKTHRCTTPDPQPAAPISDSTHCSCYWNAARWILRSCSFVVLWLSADLHPAVWFTFRLWIGLPASNWLLIVLLLSVLGSPWVHQTATVSRFQIKYLGVYTFFKKVPCYSNFQIFTFNSRLKQRDVTQSITHKNQQRRLPMVILF